MRRGVVAYAAPTAQRGARRAVDAHAAVFALGHEDLAARALSNTARIDHLALGEAQSSDTAIGAPLPFQAKRGICRGRERSDDSPDIFVGDGSLRVARQVSKTNPFQKDYAWGKSELVNYRTVTGLDLQGVLLYPANYDASKKYPMIVNPYELLSQTLHQFFVPTERSYYDPAVWTANGYFVLKPDIVFRGRDPGISVLEALEPAVRSVTSRGLADSTKVGLVGHSWGGYEATFVPTRTNMFAAAVAGAPITNFLSFAGAIHWTPGIAEFDHWETGQARMDVPFWEDMAAYVRNSPAAKVN